MMQPAIPADWRIPLQAYIESPQFAALTAFVAEEYQRHTIYPPREEIFQALTLTPYDQVRVVILGQDPYHGPNQANGLAFSVAPGVKIPPSLRNIYQELVADVGISVPQTGDLTSWAQQGVLLLNTVLTVRQGQAHSHRNQGWEWFTDGIIQALNNYPRPLIYVLWGNASIAKSQLIDQNKHVIIQAPHPSPLAAYRGFFGSKPFSQINQQLINWNQSPIHWELPEEVHA